MALTSTTPATAQGPDPSRLPQPATEVTRAIQRGAASELPPLSEEAIADAEWGLVAEFGVAPILNAAQQPIWSLGGYEFLAAADVPNSVHPGLWQHARLNLRNGLFKVSDRVYQVRGLDISNMTILEGDTGLIVIDPLLSVETARAAMDLYRRHRPDRPVVAVVYTHSHADRFGGVRGVVDEADVLAGKVQVIAPAGFMAAALSENVMAGPVMLRRGHYQFGGLLPRSEREHVDAGLGKSISRGTVTLIAPTRSIEREQEKHRIDGIDMVFQLVPDSEAPSEMIMFYPQFAVLNTAEVASRHMHNLLPVRGAMVRDARNWSRHIGQALRDYGGVAEVVIMQHHWPVRGRKNVSRFLGHQRDMYKFVHDQTLRLMNHGLGPDDIAQRIVLPATLRADWSTHDFYGSVKHNVKAIYQRYVGWYDGNPVHLDPLPPVEEARKAVDYMGGVDAVLARARSDFAREEYRWIAKVAHQVLLFDPGNAAARVLGADALEQLGYQAESPTVRNSYLQGARELRLGMPKLPAGPGGRPDIVRAMPLELYFDYLGVRLDSSKVGDEALLANWRFTDLAVNWVVELSNRTLSAHPGAANPDAEIDLTLTRGVLDEISMGRASFRSAVESGGIRITRGQGSFLGIVDALDTFPSVFPIVAPADPSVP
ncbi:alkyl sulfatase dimerization domain-containing protein [Variovorax sp. J31P179]|uniref:alkyl/aryl-sulfatase n=1 Tax=Variovorax sp. J31P179 TaxID=3053508 RepID=UPI002576F677|nr:alkyl sulfatase dimerization domain-containing protein [Variovorax sp. J31P179]MDM0085373.1 alkyl sulfatase dimerization domain-containing protein [Variovorax sp. J31P179]